MPLSFTIGETTPADKAQISKLYASAFPEEELVSLVEALLPEPGVLSLSARIGALLIGHILFTRSTLEGRPETVALLGPLAVHPDHQRRGIGKALIAEGLAGLTTEGVTQVLVLGDPPITEVPASARQAMSFRLIRFPPNGQRPGNGKGSMAATTIWRDVCSCQMPGCVRNCGVEGPGGPANLRFQGEAIRCVYPLYHCVTSPPQGGRAERRIR